MAGPNILITGTPGTGKTQTSIAAAEATGLKHINVGDIAKQNDCYESHDDAFDTNILDDDKILDILEPIMAEGGCIVDFHSVELFPERWFDLVLVLRANTDVLFDRLVARDYNELKRNENIECEIMNVVLEEAKENYNPEIVVELQSNTIEDLESNVSRISSWLAAWKQNNP